MLCRGSITIVLLAYLDEFGHIGPYISAQHAKFNTHPAFGYAGFVIPAQNVRAFGGYFEHIKEKLLAFEIQQAGAHPRRWEKKGASLLTTRNYQAYGREIGRALRRLSFRLGQLDGRMIFYGQVKPTGSANETGESASDRSAHALKQTILRLSRYANARDAPIMIFLDAVDAKPRQEAVMSTASFIYRAHDPVLRRVLEVPMQLESHFYGTTQYADWLCAMLSRASHYHFVPQSEFSWAPPVLERSFGAGLRHVSESRIRLADGTTYVRMDKLTSSDCWLTRTPTPVRTGGQQGAPRSIAQRVGEVHPALAALRDSLNEI